MKKLSLLFLTVMLGMGAFAQTTYSWRSQATNGNWNVANNWWNGSTTAVPTGGEILKIENDNQLTMTNDLSVTNRHQIIFTSYATKSRTITGTTENTFNNYNNDVNKKPKIENNSSATQTIDFPLKAGADFELNPISGDLIISGTYDRNGKTTKVSPNTTTTKTLYVKNSFTGSGDIYLLNGSTMNIDGGSITGGTVYVENGTLTFAGTGNLSTSTDVRISASKVMNLNNVNVNVKSVAERASNNAGTINLGSGTLTLEGGWSQTIYQNSIIGTGSLIKKGTGIIALFGTQSYAGTTTIEGGTVATIVSMSSSTITVKSGASFDVNDNITINNLIVESGGTLNIAAGKTLTINAGKQVTINGTVNNNSTGKIKLLSDVNGTATLTGSYSGPAEVNQYLASQRNWYMSSPVTAGTMPAGGYLYNETLASGNWQTVSSGASMTTGKGYIIAPSAAGNVSFIGTLNNGDKSIGLTRTDANTSYKGFNLVGNPYPSFLNSATLLSANSTKVENNIWYRTANWDGGLNKYIYQFQTYNSVSDVSVPKASNGSYIPPMQAFWVRAISNGVDLNFTNAMRKHNDSTVVIKLRAPKAPTADRQYVRLQVSNAGLNDELLLYSDANASNAYDKYDSPKMMNSSNSSAAINLYTTVGSENLVIDGRNSLPLDVVIPITFTANAFASGSYNIFANELANLPSGVTVKIIDNGVETSLSDGGTYTFTADAGTTKTFGLILRSPGAITGVENGNADKFHVYANSNRQIVVNAPATTLVNVYNSIGQRITIQNMNGTSLQIDVPAAGVYLVNVGGNVYKVVAP